MKGDCMNKFWRVFIPVARNVLQILLAILDTLSPYEAQQAADYINSHVGGSKKIQPANLKIIIDAAIHSLDAIKM
jgi:hypothetical protein